LNNFKIKNQIIIFCNTRFRAGIYKGNNLFIFEDLEMLNRISRIKNFLFCIFVISIFAVPTGYAAAPFLNFSPSAIINGMGGASLALNNDKTFSFIQNPANIADNSKNIWVNLGFSPKTEAYYKIDFRTIAINAGYNLKKNEGDLPLTVAIGYSNLLLDLGRFTRTAENGQVLGTYDSDENANIISVGAVLDYGVKFGIGINTKFINSNLTPNNNDNGNGNTVGFDFGLNCQVPILTSAKISENFEINLGFNAALAFQNFGDEIRYMRASDPLPRKTSIGYAVTSNLKSDFLGFQVNVAELNWTAQFSDIMVDQDSLGHRYTPMFSNSRPLSNLFFLIESPHTSINWGGNISLFETLHLYIGGNAYEGMPNNSLGIGFGLEGIFKYLNKKYDNKLTEFLSKHINIAYYYSKSGDDFEFVRREDKYSTFIINFHNFNL
jgi:hypothetical protein